ncbi:hypothetical protein ACWCSD_22780 [Nonomuraea sp. NPDC001684]
MTTSRPRLRAVVISATAALVAGLGLTGSTAGAATGVPPADPVIPSVIPSVIPYEDAPAVAREQPATPPRRTTVTLVTGEQVRLDVDEQGRQSTTVVSPGAVQAGGTYLRFGWHGDQYVIPSTAVPFLDRLLDPRLFNVSHLARTGNRPVPVKATTGRLAAMGATITPDEAPALGRVLAEEWRAGRGGTPAGVERISAPDDAPPSPFQRPATAKAAAGAYHTLSIDSVDLDGKPGAVVAYVHSVDDTDLGFYTIDYPGETGEVAFSVPEGTYAVEASVFTGPADDLTSRAAFVVQPEIKVGGDVQVTLDARTAVPYDVEVEEPTEGMYRQDMFAFVRKSEAGNSAGVDAWGLGAFQLVAFRIVSNPEFGSRPLYATPTRPVRKGSFSFAAYTQLTETASGSPSRPTYRLVLPYAKGVPGSLARRVRNAELTTVRSTIVRSPYGQQDRFELFPEVFLPWTQTALGVGASVLPGERTDYLFSGSPDITVWHTAFNSDDGARHYDQRRTLRPGSVVREVWNKAPGVPSRTAPYRQESTIGFGGDSPLVDDPFATLCVACRQGDLGMIYPQRFADATPGHYTTGNSWDEHSGLDFYRNGELAFTSDNRITGNLGAQAADLPMLPEQAVYRLVWKQDQRGELAGTPVTTDWTFRSGPSDRRAELPKSASCVPDATRECSFLPLLFLRYDLPLDAESKAKAGPFEVAFAVENQEHMAAPKGVEATVAVSYDDGATWSEPQTAARRAGGLFAATIRHPDSGGFVSLRVRAHDRQGNAVEQTVVRAYGLTS